MMKRLKAKEEEIKKIGKLNWAMEEKVKSLCMENQIWRDLAQTNEATTNALRSNRRPSP
ncbi:Probable BOI-related E3 ubiquitin-protein ligase 3 [Linum perenne]